MKIVSKLQLPLVIFFILITTTFLGSYSSDLSADPCGESCKTDCQGITGQERGVCMRQCLGGRCDNKGVQHAAELLGKTGFDCSADGQCNEFCDSSPDPDCSYFPPGHVGYAVKVFLNGTIYVFAPDRVSASGDATATQDLSGTVMLSATPCIDGGGICSNSASVRKQLPDSFPVGTTVNFMVQQVEGLPATNTIAHCRLDRNSDQSTISGSVIQITPATIGDNFFALIAEEPEGIVLHCENFSHVSR